MENKKQLVIVPPISQPLKKLNEVLDSIAIEENIEISLIDDYKELAQFIGSSGQCLVIFASAKKCATFLQENRVTILRTHSKVIILTPTEIPAKTLIKFNKIGLTESILDSSPPKTLLYKVKLLLRAIKTSTGPVDKDQLLKNALEGMSSDQTQVGTEETNLNSNLEVKTSEESFNYLIDEKARAKKKNQTEITFEESEPLKKRAHVQEEAIETHWKSKRNTDINEVDEDGYNVETKKKLDSDNIETYITTMQKKQSSLIEEEESLYSKKPQTVEEIELEKARRKSNYVDEIKTELGEIKKKYVEEEAGDFVYDRVKDNFQLEAADEEKNESLNVETLEEKLAAKKREYDELEALFEAARKKQAEMLLEEEDTPYNFISNPTQEDEKEESEDDGPNDYDNSLKGKRKKDIDLDLEIENKKRKKAEDETEEFVKKKPHEGEVDQFTDDPLKGKNSTDTIDKLMMSDFTEDDSKQITTHDIIKKKKNELEIEEADDVNKKRPQSELEFQDDEQSRKSNEELENPELKDRKKKLNLEENDEDGLFLKNLDQKENDDHERKRDTKELLPKADKEEREREGFLDEEDPFMNFKKLDAQNEEDNRNGSSLHEGKVEKIDKYYRSLDSKKQDQDWDIGQKKKTVEISLEKAKKSGDNETIQKLSKNLGEITIDYRKLKEEFDHMARGETLDEHGNPIAKSYKISDSDDLGSFRVIEATAKSLDFGIHIINMLYQKEIKPLEVYQAIAKELITVHRGYSLFYKFQLNDQKFIEDFSSFKHFEDQLVSVNLKDWWFQLSDNKDDFEALQNHYHSKSMTTWLCREIENKSEENNFWEDVELPSWAQDELINKKVELIFPYFDGLDRMGFAIVYFPEGINPKMEKDIQVLLEFARSVQLDSIQRKMASRENDKEENEKDGSEKKNILNSLTGLFGRNKAS